MSKREQKKFVRDRSASVVKSINEQIAKGLIPENWDGHELRSLLAYRHGLSGNIGNVMSNKRGARYREFQNTIIVNNL